MHLNRDFLKVILFGMLFFWCGLASSKTKFSVIEKDHKKGLVNEKGEVVIPVEYEDLGWSNGTPMVIDNVIGYKKNGRWGLLNTKNQKIIDSEYVDLFPYQDDALICSRVYFGSSSPQFGLINTKGKLLIEFQYGKLEKNGSRLIAMKNERNRIKYGLIDEDGEVFIPFNFKRIKPLNDKFYAVSSDLFSFEILDEEGNQVVKEIFDSVGIYQDGYARIFKNGMQGLIDPSGQIVAEPIYKSIKFSSEGSISALRYPKWEVLDHNNQQRASFHYGKVIPFKEYIYKVKLGEIEALVNFSDENITDFKKYNFLQLVDTIISYSYLGKQGLMSTRGNEIMGAIFDSVYIDLPNIYTYQREGDEKGWSLRNAFGEVISSDLYDDIKRLNRKVFKVRKGKYWGLVDREGKEIVLCKYDSIEAEFEGRFKVHFYGDNGVLNQFGDWLILPNRQEIDLIEGDKYLIRSYHGSEVNSFLTGNVLKKKYLLFPFENAYLEKNLELKLGLFDQRGYRICPSIYDHISSLQEDSIYIARKDSAYSFISKGGITLNYLDPRFEEVQEMSEQFIGVMIDGKYGFVDPNGDLRIANRYEDIGAFNQGIAPVKILGKWGFVNKAEQIVIQPRYKEVIACPNGLFIVVQDELYGIINSKGEMLVRTEYDKIERLKSGAYAAHQKGNLGLFSKYGKTLVLPRFDSITDLDNGFLIVSRKGKYGLLTTEGLNAIPMVYDELNYDSINRLYLAKKESEWVEVR